MDAEFEEQADFSPPALFLFDKEIFL